MSTRDLSLFDEPTEDLERMSEWDAPHGFLLGGICVPNREGLASQYIIAAETLVESVFQKRAADCDVAYPVLFLYRQAVELLLKNILGPSRTHSLASLTTSLEEHIKSRLGKLIHPFIPAMIRDLAAFDDESMTFRYLDTSDPLYTDCKPGTGSYSLASGERHVDLRRLQQGMRDLTDALVQVAHLSSEISALTTAPDSHTAR